MSGNEEYDKLVRDTCVLLNSISDAVNSISNPLLRDESITVEAKALVDKALAILDNAHDLHDLREKWWTEYFRELFANTNAVHELADAHKDHPFAHCIPKEFQPPPEGCDVCEYAERRFNSGNGMTRCHKLMHKPAPLKMPLGLMSFDNEDELYPTTVATGQTPDFRPPRCPFNESPTDDIPHNGGGQVRLNMVCAEGKDADKS